MNNTTDSPKNINTNPFVRCFNGLDLLFKHNQTMAIILLVISLFSAIFQFAGNFIPADSGPPERAAIASAPDPINIALLLAVLIPIVLIAMVVGIVLSTYVNGITNYVAWKTSKAETATFGESFRVVTKRFWTLLAVQVFVGLRIIGGLLLFIVPGIRAALRYQMVYFPVFDEGLNASNAMKRIKALTKNHLMEVFGIATVSAIVPVIGLLLSMGGEAVMYPELKELKASGAPSPKVHRLNYLGLILLGLLIVFISALAALIVAAMGN